MRRSLFLTVLCLVALLASNSTYSAEVSTEQVETNTINFLRFFNLLCYRPNGKVDEYYEILKKIDPPRIPDERAQTMPGKKGWILWYDDWAFTTSETKRPGTGWEYQDCVVMTRSVLVEAVILSIRDIYGFAATDNVRNGNNNAYLGRLPNGEEALISIDGSGELVILTLSIRTPLK